MGIIVGYEKEKREIEELKKMLQNFEKFKKCGVRIPRGLLLHGEPGVGKTALAKSIAGDGINIIELRASLCFDDETSDVIRDVFRKAKANAPSVLLLDELDKLAGANNIFYMENNDTVKKVLLAELDKLSDLDRVLVVGTCNDNEVLGEALVRPGRFDRIISVDLPDENTRKSILEAYFERIKIDRDFDILSLARNTKGFSGARLECLTNEAGIIALQKNNPIITEDDIRLVINKMLFGALEKNPFEDYKALHRVAVHEAGHALAVMLLCPDNIFGVSIMPQGQSNGHISFISNGTVQSVSEIENEVAIMLAGHVAERYELEEYLIGSSLDMKKAMARIYYLATKEAAYGYKYIIDDSARGRDISAATQAELDCIVDKKISEIDIKVEKLISENYQLYREIVNALECKFVLSAEDLKRLAVKDKTAYAI